MFEDGDGTREVEVECEQQVDVVEVLVAGEAVGEVVSRVDIGEHVNAMRAEEAEAAVAHLRGRAFAAEVGDGDGHRQVVAESAEQVGGGHGDHFQ